MGEGLYTYQLADDWNGEDGQILDHFFPGGSFRFERVLGFFGS